MLKVKDRTSRNLFSMDVNETALKAASAMHDNKVGCILLKRDGEFVGIVTETDIVRRVVAEGKDPAETALDQIMSTHVLSIDIEKPLYDVANIMDANHIRHMAVTDDDKIIGVISVRDLIHPEFTDGEGW